MESERRKSTRKSCPVTNPMQLVVIKTSKSQREVFSNLKVNIKRCFVPLKSDSNEDGCSSDEVTSESDEDETLLEKKINLSDNEILLYKKNRKSEEEETLLDKKMKKYPKRQRAPLCNSNTAVDVAKPIGLQTPPAGKENSRRTPVRKSRKSIVKKGSYLESSDSEDGTPGKKRGKGRKSSKQEDSDWEEEEGCAELEEEVVVEDPKDGDSKSYPMRKRKGSESLTKDLNNSARKNVPKKLRKSQSVVDEIVEEDEVVEDSCPDDSDDGNLEQSTLVEMECESDKEVSALDASMTEVVGDSNNETNSMENVQQLNDVDEEENVVRPRVLTANALDGQSIFGFVTPKRKDALAKIAQDVIDSAKSAKKSARKSSKKSLAYNQTPKSMKKTSASNTPNRKMKNKVTLLHTLAANESDDEDDDDDDDEELSDSEDSEDDNAPLKSSVKTKVNHDLLDQYFELHGKAAATSLTSDKTLAKLKNPKMGQQELLAHLKEVQTSHINEIVNLHRSHQKEYKTWMLNLLSGFNVLVYGFGSKQMLLEKFRKTMLQQHEHIVVNGFFPNIQLKQILKTITEQILEKETTFKNTIEHYKYIVKEYNTGNSGKLFIIVHNIDGHMLRSQNIQAAIAHLATSCNIHIIASIDHINAPLVWDQNRAAAFNWVWYDTTTFESYSEETSYENSLMVQQSGTLALSAVKHVLQSLPSNSKGVFRVLADYHLDNEDNSSYQGMSFHDLLQRCRERFLVNSDLALRGQLTEFRDHKLVKSKKGVDGIDYLSMAVECETLRVYLDGDEC